MIESVLIILIAIAVVLLIMAYEWKDIIISLIDAVIWFILALWTLDIEIPYQMYNSSSSAIETGFQNVSIPPLTYLFLMLGVIMFLSFVIRGLSTLKNKK